MPSLSSLTCPRQLYIVGCGRIIKRMVVTAFLMQQFKSKHALAFMVQRHAMFQRTRGIGGRGAAVKAGVGKFCPSFQKAEIWNTHKSTSRRLAFSTCTADFEDENLEEIPSLHSKHAATIVNNDKKKFQITAPFLPTGDQPQAIH